MHTIRITEENLERLIKATEHYAAYLRATNRDHEPYDQLAEELRRGLPKE